jgi:hypothetical protein
MLSIDASEVGQLSARLQQVQQRITQACQQAERDPEQVNLLAVSKTQSAPRIAALQALGINQFGENYWQEAQSKQLELQPLAITWHFIGALQSNKAKMIAQHFAWVHSVGSIAVAEKLSAARDPQSAPLQICVQVNLDQEISKQGVEPSQLSAVLARLIGLPQICVRGLMLLPAQAQAPTERLARFQELSGLLTQAKNAFAKLQHPFDTLSMGMSEDLELAIAAGSHWVRVGSALFGPRAAQNSKG